MLIGVLSDSHVRVPGTRAGLSSLTAEKLPTQVLDVFKGVELILHAGDVYTIPVLEQLQAVAPVLVSEGDDDPFEVVNDPRAKHEQFLELEGVTIWMSHYGLWPENYVDEMPDVIIYGHTHRSHLERRDGSLWLNPGSCNFPRYEHVLGTVALLTVKDGQAEAKLVQLEGDIGGSITTGLPGKY